MLCENIAKRSIELSHDLSVVLTPWVMVGLVRIRLWADAGLLQTVLVGSLNQRQIGIYIGFESGGVTLFEALRCGIGDHSGIVGAEFRCG